MRNRTWTILAIMGVVGIVVVGLILVFAPASKVSGPGRAIHRVKTTEKVVALTYDDGPHPVYTPRILKILKKYSVKATFFMVGNRMEKNPRIVKAVVDGGNAIGNHTYTHPLQDTPIIGKHLDFELTKTQQIIERLTGGPTHLYRPPKGLKNDEVLRIAHEHGYRTILWSVCIDHHDAPTPQAMAERAIDRLQPGMIILAHDGVYPTRWKDVVATELILKELKKRGYRFVTVPELLKLASHSKP